MTDNDGEAKINFLNMRLVEFDIQTQISLVDSIYKICCKWAINVLTESKHNNFITLLIMNERAEISTHIVDSFTIYQYHIKKFDCPSIDDIDQVNIDVVVLW